MFKVEVKGQTLKKCLLSVITSISVGGEEILNHHHVLDNCLEMKERLLSNDDEIKLVDDTNNIKNSIVDIVNKVFELLNKDNCIMVLVDTKGFVKVYKDFKLVSFLSIDKYREEYEKTLANVIEALLNKKENDKESGMNRITVINTGGTFSKVYDANRGEMVIRKGLNELIEEINSKTYLDKNIDFTTYDVISKDSIYITDKDREDLASFINKLDDEKIVIVHGTDTISETAMYLEEHIVGDKTIVLTGSMIPYSVDPIEAVSNYTQAVKDCLRLDKGVYLSLHGVVGSLDEVYKDRSMFKYKDFYFTKKNWEEVRKEILKKGDENGNTKI